MDLQTTHLDDFLDDSIELNELLFAMYGYYGSVFDPSFDEPTLSKHFSAPHCASFIKELLHISSLYVKISCISDALSTETNEFKSVIHTTLKNFLNRTYLNTLREVEFKRLNIFTFNVFLKYSRIFSEVLEILNKMDNNNECNILSRLRMLLTEKYELSQLNDGLDPFFQLTCEWMFLGKVPLYCQPSFYLSKSSNNDLGIDFLKWPEGVNQRNALKILNVGTFVENLRSLKINTEIYNKDLYLQLAKNQSEFYKYHYFFDEFVTDLQKNIRSGIYNLAAYKDTLAEHLKNFHLFHLHRQEYFWNNLVEQIGRNSDRQVSFNQTFRETLFATYDSELAQFYTKTITAFGEKKDDTHLIKLHFNLPSLTKLLLKKNHIRNYNVILAYLFKVLQTRNAVIGEWKDKTVQRKDPRCFLLHWCCRTLGAFYTFSRFCIEHKMNTFINECSKQTMDLEQICQFHETCLLQLTEELFLNNTLFRNLINELVKFSWSVVNSSRSISELLESYKVLRRHVTNSYGDTCEIRRSEFIRILQFI